MKAKLESIGRESNHKAFVDSEKNIKKASNFFEAFCLVILQLFQFDVPIINQISVILERYFTFFVLTKTRHVLKLTTGN